MSKRSLWRCYGLLVMLCSHAAVAQVEEPSATVSFGALPNFFTGTMNTLDLQISVEPGCSIVSYVVSVGGHQAHQKTFNSPEPSHHTLHLVWDSTSEISNGTFRFPHGTAVSYTVSGVIRLVGGATQNFLETSGSRTVYNKKCVHSDSSYDWRSGLIHSEGLVALLFCSTQSDVLGTGWTSTSYADDALGSIRMATHVQTLSHGSIGIIHPPGGGEVNKDKVAVAVQAGLPTDRPPLQFAFVISCKPFANPEFGAAYLAGAPTTGRAAIGFKVTITATEMTTFSDVLYQNLNAGKPIMRAAESAFEATYGKGASFTEYVSVLGDLYAKLRGVYRGSYDDAYIAWVHATEEG